MVDHVPRARVATQGFVIPSIQGSNAHAWVCPQPMQPESLLRASGSFFGILLIRDVSIAGLQ